MGKDAPHPKYLVANADEMEPGTFKDRVLMEGDPHQFIEGMIIAAYAIEADVGYIFLRGEYKKSAERLTIALARLVNKITSAGIPRFRIHFDIHLHVSAGRYICGEETALLNALEGNARIPGQSRRFHKYRVCGANPPLFKTWKRFAICRTLSRRPRMVSGLSKSEDGGTKLFGASGKVKRPGLWELPLGTTSARNSRGTRRRYAGRTAFSRCAARRRLNRFPG